MNADFAKIIAMLTLGFGSLIVGMIPAAFANFSLRNNKLLLTFLLCFGAGILLATSLVHILPEVSKIFF
jgi:zinc transporter 1/2/3